VHQSATSPDKQMTPAVPPHRPSTDEIHVVDSFTPGSQGPGAVGINKQTNIQRGRVMGSSGLHTVLKHSLKAILGVEYTNETPPPLKLNLIWSLFYKKPN